VSDTVHTLYISYFIEHNGDDEPHDEKGRKSHRQTQCTLQLANERRVLFVRDDLQVAVFWRQQPECAWAIRLVSHLSFVHSSQTAANKT